MSSMEKYLIYYYLQSDHSSSVLALTDKHSNLPEYALYGALVYIRVGQYVEAIRRLNELNRHDMGDCKLATLLLLIVAHKKCMDPDFGTISELELSLKQAQPCSNEKSLALAALGLYFTRHVDKAIGFAEKVLKLNSSNVEARLVLTWTELSKKQTKNANTGFQAIATLEPKCIPALIGDVLTSTDRSEQLSKLNRILVQYPTLDAPLIEKLAVCLSGKDWIECNELSERLARLNENSSVANKMKIFHLINVQGNYEEGAKQLLNAYSTILEHEMPDPCPVLFDWSKLFARICGRNKSILSVTLKFVQHCAHSQLNSVPYLKELAYQHYLLGQYDQALRGYRSAIKLDDSSVELLSELTLAQWEIGARQMNEQISQQLDLLTEISSKSPSPHITLIQISQLSSQTEIRSRLDGIVRSQMSLVARQPFGYQYLIDLNVDLLLTVLAEYLKLSDSTPVCISLLVHLTTLCPGLIPAALLLARLYLTIPGPDSANQMKGILGRLIETRPEYSLAHVMLCLVCVRENEFDKASQHLELALSNDLKLIETPLYNAMKGLIEDHKGRLVESVHSLKTTRQLIQSKKGSQPGSQHSSGTGFELATIEQEILHTLDPTTLCLVYQKLCSNLSKTQTQPSEELDKYIGEASTLLKGTHHWVDVSLMIAEVKEKTDPKYSLELLSKVPEQHDKYIQAVESMASIYLNRLRSPDNYIGCYKTLLQKTPSTENYVRLAEAYLNIQDADSAVATYETARRVNPSVKFGVKLARIFVKTHRYEAAIRCYKEEGSGGEGAIELATLYVGLGHLDVARETLEGLERPVLASPVLAKIKEKSSDIRGAYDTLLQGVETCAELRTHAHTKQLAQYATQLRDFHAAIGHYRTLLNDVSRLNEQETHSVYIALIKLYMQISDWKSCESLCSQLLNSNSGGAPGVNGAPPASTGSAATTARLMLADATFRRGDFQSASDHFASIVSSSQEQGQGMNYTALARYIEIQRRLATLKEGRVTDMLAGKVGRGVGGVRPPGYCYCQGLFEWYSGNPLVALGWFNRAKHDSEWGQQSLHNMVEICLANPEVAGSSIKPGNGGALEMADSFIKEMNPCSLEEDWSCKLLSNFIRCASLDRIEFEMALNEFTRLAQNEGTRVGASLGLAKCYVHHNQSSRARNILKLLAKTPWTFEEADYLESCWLLLAELLIQDSKLDRAATLIQHTLGYNKSSAKSYELLANIAESRDELDTAVKYYNQALRLGVSSEPGLSLKLASLLLRMRRYGDAMDVCMSARRKDASTWHAHRTVYERAMNHLRT
uniref:Tetratricopeptide repeat protein 21B n=1 Tax=Cacopsylla melanoneura TaxID=428564 RepID=A0A8D9DUB0_9HEMI